MAGRGKEGTPRVAVESGEVGAPVVAGVSEAGGGFVKGELIDANGA